MVVQHNMQSINANRQLGIVTGQQAKSTEKLSSGYRINRAADDAAGLSISEKMRRQIRGLDRASTNAQDGVSAVQTAEGALNEVHDMLQRMNELANQASNGTNSITDRQAIQDEISQLNTEIDRVSETTKFNELYLMKGAPGTQEIRMKGHDAGLAGTLADYTNTASFTAELDTDMDYQISGQTYHIYDEKDEIDNLKDKIDDADTVSINGTTYSRVKGGDSGIEPDPAAAAEKTACAAGRTACAAGLEASGAALKASGAALSGSAAALESSAATLKGSAASLKASAATLNKSAATLKGSAATMQKSAATLAKSATSMQSDAQKLFAQAESMQAEADALAAEADDLLAQAEALEDGDEKISLEAQAAEKQAKAAEKQSSASSKLASAQGKAASAAIKKASADTKTASAKTKAASAETKAASAESKSASAKTKGASATTKSASAATKTASAKGKAASAEAKYGEADVKKASAAALTACARALNGGEESKDAILFSTPDRQYLASELKAMIVDGAQVGINGSKARHAVDVVNNRNNIKLDESVTNSDGTERLGALDRIKNALTQANYVGVDNTEEVSVTGGERKGGNNYEFDITKGKVTVANDLNFDVHVGADADMTNKIGVNISTMNSQYLGVQNLQVADDSGIMATYAIDAVEDAIQKVNEQRSALGAVQNRLEHTINNLDNVVENTTAAESRIRDTDIADEMVKYSKNNILSQAGQSMLAQANQSTQGALSLLG